MHCFTSEIYGANALKAEDVNLMERCTVPYHVFRRFGETVLSKRPITPAQCHSIKSTVLFIYYDNDVVFRITYFTLFIILTILIPEFAVLQLVEGRMCILESIFPNTSLKVVF